MYSAVTRGSKLRSNLFIWKSNPSRRKPLCMGYRVTIVNNSSETVQLCSRYWQITDANGHVQEVRGSGVVGEQPVLDPGDSYQYSSGCPLTTSSGVMVGATR
ncbi:hypothetical protein BR10RB9215_C12185 [Brucella sp. 10RB9215]|nr:hypothetical protein BR10RB9215_C12185 [Brucella sp. 10RB9215]